MKNGKLVVGIISAGMISNAAHIPAYRSLGDKIELAGICDLSEAAAKATAQRHGIEHYYTDARRMLEELQPDLVSVCTPNASHKDMVALALNAGANVACEKPMALTYADTKALFELAARKKKKLFACQTLRYEDDLLVAKEMADSGALGEVYFGEFSVIRRRGIPKWGTFHRMDANGGGALCDLGVHMIDAMLWVLGNPAFEAVSGSMASYIGRSETDVITSLKESGAPAGVHNARPFSPGEFEVEEFATGIIRLAGGISLNFKVSWAINLPGGFHMSFAGSKAGLTLPDVQMYGTQGRYQADIKPKVFHEGKYAGRDFAGHYYLLENAADCLLGESELLVKPEETLNVAAIIDAFYISAREGREVRGTEIISNLS